MNTWTSVGGSSWHRLQRAMTAGGGTSWAALGTVLLQVTSASSLRPSLLVSGASVFPRVDRGRPGHIPGGPCDQCPGPHPLGDGVAITQPLTQSPSPDSLSWGSTQLTDSVGCHACDLGLFSGLAQALATQDPLFHHHQCPQPHALCSASAFLPKCCVGYLEGQPPVTQRQTT